MDFSVTRTNKTLLKVKRKEKKATASSAAYLCTHVGTHTLRYSILRELVHFSKRSSCHLKGFIIVVPSRTHVVKVTLDDKKKPTKTVQ